MNVLQKRRIIMKRYFRIVIVCMYAVLLSGISCESASEKTSVLSAREMQELLSRNGLEGFVREVKARKCLPPVFWSEWYVKKLEKEDEIRGREERENRKAGKMILDELDRANILANTNSTYHWLFPPIEEEDKIKQADGIQNVITNELRSIERMCNLAMDISEWVGQAEGYGNILIGRKARDIAAVGAGYLAVEKRYPITSVKALLRRIESGFVQPRTVARVLNKEARLNLFNPDARSWDEITETFHSLLLGMDIQRSKANRANVEKILGGNMTAKLKKVVEGKEEVLREFLENEPIELNFQPTISDMWEKKRHGNLIGEDAKDKCELIQGLIKYREKGGKFKDTYSDFMDSYLESELDENLITSVWRLYKAIRERRFTDEDSIKMANRAEVMDTIEKTGFPSIGGSVNSMDKPESISISGGRWLLRIFRDGSGFLGFDPCADSMLSGIERPKESIGVKSGVIDFDKIWETVKSYKVWSRKENSLQIWFGYRKSGNDHANLTKEWGRYLKDMSVWTNLVQVMIEKASDGDTNKIRRLMKDYPVDDPKLLEYIKPYWMCIPE
jgi:hypothetical protein